MANRARIGQLGEAAACRYLKQRGFNIVERNFRRPWGELDVIAERDGALHFVEVKATAAQYRTGGYRPEEHVDRRKLERLRRIVQTYLAKHRFDVPWNFHVIVAYVNETDHTVRIEFLENLVL